MSVAKECVVKEWVKKTKQVLKEEERKQAIVLKFMEIFNIEPDTVRWTADKTLEARTQIKEFEEILKILDREVKEIIFILEECEEKEEIHDQNWRFEQRKHPLYHIYRWSKILNGRYIAIVEIYTKIY